MKKILFIALAFISISASAQNYNDSTITLTLTQRGANYIGQYIKYNTADVWKNITAPATLKNYVGSGTHPDSLFSVTIKAGYITGMIEKLLKGDCEVVYADRLSIINNSPSIPSYTALSSQIITLANGNGATKQTAIFIRDFYLQRVADFANTNTANKSEIINWVGN